VIEAAVVSVADRVPRLRIRRGVAVDGLVAGMRVQKDVPHVVGVRLETGQKVPADLVLDMTGRRSLFPGWLEEIGARPPGRSSRTAASAITPATSVRRGDSSMLPGAECSWISAQSRH
jgi:hypothetical protein